MDKTHPLNAFNWISNSCESISRLIEGGGASRTRAYAKISGQAFDIIHLRWSDLFILILAALGFSDVVERPVRSDHGCGPGPRSGRASSA